MANHLLQAPTVEITRMLHRDIVVWLSEVGEARASMTRGPASVATIPMLLVQQGTWGNNFTVGLVNPFFSAVDLTSLRFLLLLAGMLHQFLE